MNSLPLHSNSAASTASSQATDNSWQNRGMVDEDDDDGLGVTHADGKRYVEVAPAASYAGEGLEPIVRSYFMGFVPAGLSIEPARDNKRTAQSPTDEPPAKK